MIWIYRLDQNSGRILSQTVMNLIIDLSISYLHRIVGVVLHLFLVLCMYQVEVPIISNATALFSKETWLDSQQKSFENSLPNPQAKL